MPVQPAPEINTTITVGGATGAALSRSVKRRGVYQVLVKGRWSDAWNNAVRLDDGSFAASKFIECTTITHSVSPSFSSAALHWASGTIARADESAFTRRVWAVLRGMFVKIEFIAFGSRSASTLFIGYVPEVIGKARRSFAALSPEHSADQTQMAYGLEFLLDRSTINSSWILKPAFNPDGERVPEDDTAAEIPHTLVFNAEFNVGLAPTDGESPNANRKGNRSLLTIKLSTDQDDDVPESYVFDGEHNSQPWSAYDIVEYLIRAYAPRTRADENGNTIPSQLNGMNWRIHPPRPQSGQNDRLFKAIDEYIPVRLAAENRSIKAVLDELFGPERGLGWRVVPSLSDGDNFVEIFSLVDEPFAVGDYVLPANPSTASIVQSDETPIVSIQVQNDILTKYGKIVVQGEQLLTCFNLAIRAGSLEPSWGGGGDLESEYDFPGGKDGNNNPVVQLAETADRMRSADRFVTAGVYSRFRIPADCNGVVSTLDAANGAAKGSIDPQGSWNIEPRVNVETGEIDQDNEVIKAPRVPGFPMRTWGRRFADFVPIRQASEDEDRIEYRRPSVFIADNITDLNYAHAHRGDSGGPGSYIQLADNTLEIKVVSSPAHLIAAGIFPDDAITNTLPTHDYLTIIACVAMRTDDRLRVEAKIQGGNPDLVLTIPVEGAEAWIIQPGCLIDVTSEIPEGAGSTPPKKFVAHAGGVVRNDRQKLLRVMAAAKNWFGTSRNKLSLEFDDIVDGYAPGTPIRAILETTSIGRLLTPIRTPVTSRTIDLARMTTRIETDFLELDVSRMAKV